jgi:hypothetical protein
VIILDRNESFKNEAIKIVKRRGKKLSENLIEKP